MFPEEPLILNSGIESSTLPPVTSSFAPGVKVPIPTFPLAESKIFPVPRFAKVKFPFIPDALIILVS